jgi:hypothetical protein
MKSQQVADEEFVSKLQREVEKGWATLGGEMRNLGGKVMAFGAALGQIQAQANATSSWQQDISEKIARMEKKGPRSLPGGGGVRPPL